MVAGASRAQARHRVVVDNDAIGAVEDDFATEASGPPGGLQLEVVRHVGMAIDVDGCALKQRAEHAVIP
jgi:hypothetical protein